LVVRLSCCWAPQDEQKPSAPDTAVPHFAQYAIKDWMQGVRIALSDILPCSAFQ
jgi:hypothetical protein